MRSRPLLRVILAVSLVVGLYSEGYDRLWTPHLLDNFTFPVLFGLQPIVWFGIIRAGSSLFSIGATEIAQRQRITKTGGRLVGLMLFLDGAMLLALLALAWAGNFWVALIRPLDIQHSPQHPRPAGQRLDCAPHSGQRTGYSHLLFQPAQRHRSSDGRPRGGLDRHCRLSARRVDSLGAVDVADSAPAGAGQADGANDDEIRLKIVSNICSAWGILTRAWIA